MATRRGWGVNSRKIDDNGGERKEKNNKTKDDCEKGEMTMEKRWLVIINFSIHGHQSWQLFFKITLLSTTSTKRI
jgi:hypothetical protein